MGEIGTRMVLFIFAVFCNLFAPIALAEDQAEVLPIPSNRDFFSARLDVLSKEYEDLIEQTRQERRHLIGLKERLKAQLGRLAPVKVYDQDQAKMPLLKTIYYLDGQKWVESPFQTGMAFDGGLPEGSYELKIERIYQIDSKKALVSKRVRIKVEGPKPTVLHVLAYSKNKGLFASYLDELSISVKNGTSSYESLDNHWLWEQNQEGEDMAALQIPTASLRLLANNRMGNDFVLSYYNIQLDDRRVSSAKSAGTEERIAILELPLKAGLYNLKVELFYQLKSPRNITETQLQHRMVFEKRIELFSGQKLEIPLEAKQDNQGSLDNIRRTLLKGRITP